ncbi:hypothetical protein MOQ_001358 [Trypanosoma cruzi marinkellei]|uniref:Uncharacterized protein n=1 Tax=Trypanosoma cruzi marinkellei TaxID=85056 RepID=K2PBF3_TRYCR|nr:hypothetical protein MOQ_001358 [Trypanosoma cruzi marinkellei]
MLYRMNYFLRKLIFVLVVVLLLLIVIILPPASSTLRGRLLHYHMEELRQRARDKMLETLFLDVTNATWDDVTCGLVEAPAGENYVELNVFVVYNRKLREKLYEGINWSSLLPSSPNYLSPLANTTREVMNNHGTYRNAWTKGRHNGNRMYFLATKEPLVKFYPSHMVEGRLLREWEMPGFVANRSFLQPYSAIMTVYRGRLLGHSLDGGTPTGVAAASSSTSATEKNREWVAFLEHDVHINQPLLCRIRQRILQKSFGSRRCCIFYGKLPSNSLSLNNTMGRRLMYEYNTFFQTSFSLRDLPPVFVMRDIVVPSVLLHRTMPFLERVAELLTVNRTVRQNDGSAAVMTGQESAWGINNTPEWSLKVMEGALALSLGLERNYVHVEMPIRRFTEPELEELDRT